MPGKTESTRPVNSETGGTTQPTQIILNAQQTQPVLTGSGDTVPFQPGRGDTSPVRIQPPVEPPSVDNSNAGTGGKPKRMVGRIILLGILVVLLVGSLGGWLGYNDGLLRRRSQQASNIAVEAASQFQLGLQNMAEGRLDVAKTRFEYVIAIDPTFPGVKEKLAEVLFALAQQANPTATVEPTPTLVPTPDTSNEDTQYRFVLQQMANKNWDAAINGMDGLRKINLAYKPIEVDGLYFIALRFRGIDKMLRYADLEGGIFDLSQAEHFAALDRDAESWRTFSRLYLTGAAYWEVNWEKVVEFFAQVAPALPNLRDSSGMTAVERFRIAATKLLEIYVKDDEWCKAAKLQASLLAVVRNSNMEPTATWLANKCNPPTKTPTPIPPTGTPTPIISPTLLLVTPTPTLTNGKPATSTPTLPAATATATLPPPTSTSTLSGPAPTK